LDITSILLIFGFLGLVFGIRGKLVKSRSALVLFMFYVVLTVNYYVSMYGMVNAPVPQRILTMTDIISVPFVVLGLMASMSFLTHELPSAKTNRPNNKGRFSSVALFLVCLLSSVLVFSALYQAYPHQEITEVQPAAYELEAIQYIDSISEGNYVVLGDTNLAALAGAFLGIDYCYESGAKGYFGGPEWTIWPQKMYQQMINTPSLSVLENAMYRKSVGISYFVVSVREPYYETIIAGTSGILEPNRTLGEGPMSKLTIFRYTSPIVPISGNGPFVKVALDGGSFTDVQTEFAYLSKSSVNYNVKLSGHTSYNITDYPTNWSFQSLLVADTIQEFDESSDVNTFVYKSGLQPNDALEVTWQANDHYPRAGWKEDSFKHDWQVHPGYALSKLSANASSDGNFLRISGNFSLQGEYLWYYQSKRVNNVSTDAFPYALVSWRSTGPVAGVIVAYTDGLEQTVVPPGSEGSDWTVSIVKLEPSKEIAWIIVGISNIPDFRVELRQSVFVDYILLCAPE
jgi:hypothetical protein